jgi:hypothetical protein
VSVVEQGVQGCGARRLLSPRFPMSTSVRMMRGRREPDKRWLPDTAIREQRDRRSQGRLTPSPQEEIEWVRRQIDGPTTAIPERERLAFRRTEIKRLKANRDWVERKDKTRRRLRKAEDDLELSSVRSLSAEPLTFAHVDLPTGKRIYVPLEPGQDASSLKNCSLDAINATRRSGGVKAASDAAKAAEGARRKRKAQMKMKVAVRMGAVGGPARPHSLPALLAPGATGHALDCECPLCQRFRDAKLDAEAEQEALFQAAAEPEPGADAMAMVVAAGLEGHGNMGNSSPTGAAVNELLHNSIDGAVLDVLQASDARVRHQDHAGKRLREIFARADRNNDGTLTRAELILRLRSDTELAELLQLPARVGDGDRDAFESVFQSMDVDDSRGVDVEEFVRHFSKLAVTAAPQQQQQQQQQPGGPLLELTNCADPEDEISSLGAGSTPWPRGRAAPTNNGPSKVMATEGRKSVRILGTTDEIHSQ